MSTSAVFLVLAIAALGLGPAIYGLLRRTPWLSTLDGFVLTSVGFLLAIHVIPEAVEAAGPWALAALIIGLILPSILERLAGIETRHVQGLTMILALGGIAIHEALDGAALSGAGSATGAALSTAVLLHRLPAGLLVWWAIRPAYGTRGAAGVLVLMALATAGGFFMGERLIAHTTAEGVFIFQALVAGSMLHVIVDHAPSRSDPHYASNPRAEALGALVGFGLAAALPFLEHEHAADHSAFSDALLHLSLESAPALLAGYALAGVVSAWLPKATLAWASRGSALGQSARGVAFGLPIPICSCGVVPIYEGLIKRGLPATAAMAFLVATPELGLESVILSFPLLGGELTGFRLVAAAATALFTGWLVGRVVQRTPRVPTEDDDEAPTTHRERLRAAVSFGFAEVVDHTAAWIILGLAIAAAIGAAGPASWLAAVPQVLHVPLFALAGLPLYVCASGATPLAAGLLAAGASPGAAIAFLLAGPATNLTTFGVLSRLHGRRAAIAFGVAVSGAAIAMGYLANAVLGDAFTPPFSEPTLEKFGVFSWGALIVLGAVYAAALFRMGPRALALSLVRGDGSDGHDHSHPGPTHDHDHHHHDHDNDHHDHHHHDHHHHDHDRHSH